MKQEGDKGLWSLVTDLFNHPTNPAHPVPESPGDLPSLLAPGISPPAQRVAAGAPNGAGLFATQGPPAHPHHLAHEQPKEGSVSSLHS